MAAFIDWIAALLVRGLSALLQALPHETALGLGRIVGLLTSLVNKRRGLAYVNLKAAFGDRYSAAERKRLIRRLYCHLAQNMAETLRFPKLDQAYFNRYIVAEHRERYDRALQSGQGVIFLTPHFGNWELSQLLSSIAGQPMHVLARRQKHKRLDAFLNELRTVGGGTAIHEGGGVRELIRTLEAKGCIGVLSDLSGGRHGIITRFFGRKTTAPGGIFAIGKRTGAIVLPCFVVRSHHAHHQVTVEEPFRLTDTGDDDGDVAENVKRYYQMLESWISKFPDQWLWVYKRWKYCFTKRILVLRDGRAGHHNQSESLIRELTALRKRFSEAYEFEFQSVDVKFKSHWHQALCHLFGLIFSPFAQGRLELLRFFLDRDCADALARSSCDLIISSGSSLVPLNLMLKRENSAKSVVLMKPSFPYWHRLFDLVIVPAHDRLNGFGTSVVRTLLALNCVDEELLKSSGERLKKLASIGSNDRRRFSVFVGGDAKHYRIDPAKMEKWLIELKRYSERSGVEFLVTTSRRTNAAISGMIKKELSAHPGFKLVVIANERNIDDLTYGMLGLSETVLVTEDSVSMTSEAVTAGKRVVLMKVGNGKLSRKHNRFHQALQAKQLITFAEPSNIDSILSEVNGSGSQAWRREESERLQQALVKLI